MLKFKTRLSVVAVLVSTACYTQAQDTGLVIQTASGIDIQPTVTIETVHDNNLANTRTDKLSSWGHIVAPVAVFGLTDGVNEYSVTTGARFGKYYDFNTDDFNNFVVDGLAKMEFTEQHRVQFQAKGLYSHEQRGQGVTETFGFTTEEPATYEEYDVRGRYEYGAQQTPAKIRFSAGYLNKNYTNLREVSQYRNFDRTSAGVAFFYSTLAFTDLVVEVNHNDIKYDVDDIVRGTRDNKDVNYRVGIDWEYSALTSGEFRIGQQRKNFDNVLREDFKGLSWSLTVNYEPLSYSRFSFETGRRANDPMTDADYVKDTTYDVNWTHDWREALQTKITVGYQESDFVGVEQRNTFWRYGADVNYRLNIFSSVYASINVADRDSTVERFIFDKRVITVGFRIGV